MENLGTILQIGQVKAVNGTKAQVFFPNTGRTSDWLSVLQRPGEGVGVQQADGHTHKASVTAWVPAVGATVLVAYPPYKNADGFILGQT